MDYQNRYNMCSTAAYPCVLSDTAHKKISNLAQGMADHFRTLTEGRKRVRAGVGGRASAWLPALSLMKKAASGTL